jgi:hypothetical protein
MLEVINKLVNEYHAHGFVIDYEEAQAIFGKDNVHFISKECERTIETNFFSVWRNPSPQRRPSVDIVAYFSEQSNKTQSDALVASPPENKNGGRSNAKSDTQADDPEGGQSND